jgi:O-antigen/teichoic acid export membrane protein
MLLGGKTVGGILALVYTALAVRAIGIEAYGTLTLIQAYTLVICQALSLNGSNSVLRYGTGLVQQANYARFRQLVGFTACLDFASGLLAAAVAVTGTAWIGDLLGWPTAITPWAALYATTAVVMMRGRTPNGVLRLFDRFDLLAIRPTIQAVIRLAGAALVFFFDLGLPAILVAWFLARLTRDLYVLIASYHELSTRALTPTFHGLRSVPKNLTRFWSFVVKTNLNNSARLIQGQSIPLLIGGVMTNSAVGLFQVARQLTQATMQPIQSMRPAIYPELARLISHGDRLRLKRLVLRSAGIAAATAVTGLSLLALTGGWLLWAIGGSQAVAAYTLMLLLATANVLRLTAFPIQPLLISMGHPGHALAAQLVSAAAQIGGLLILVPYLGLEAAGVAAILAALSIIAYQFTAAGRLWQRSLAT